MAKATPELIKGIVKHQPFLAQYTDEQGGYLYCSCLARVTNRIHARVHSGGYNTYIDADTGVRPASRYWKREIRIVYVWPAGTQVKDDYNGAIHDALKELRNAHSGSATTGT